MWRVVQLIIVLGLLLGTLGRAVAQEGGEEAFIAGLIPKLSPEAKIGQLFVVSFNGTDVSANSDVADLVLNYRVGGVSLSILNGNIVNDADTPTQVASLTAALQGLSRQTTRGPNGTPFIPLYMAVTQDGDGAPNSQITSGLTPMPSYMALGATWNAQEAETAGRLTGQELSALGVNFLLGPSLDVRVQPSTSAFDPGVNVFGGDPYWVGVMAQAYVRGLRTGSSDRIAAVLKHFPGQGGLDDESFTIDRSLNDLQQIDLLPFLRLMPGETVPSGKARPLADALLTTDARYRGFNDNIRDRTGPISVDSEAMQTLLALPDVKAWRDAGGLIVSDAPGSPVVRDYYAATAGTPVSVTQIALDTFQAGNDVLILQGLTGDETRAVIQSFRQKYSTDPAFQARVDSAVQRILRSKYRLYPNFDATKVPVSVTAVNASVGQGSAVTQQVASDALTLVWPGPDKHTAVRPQPEDTFFIATDDHVVEDCRTCAPRSTLSADDLARLISQQYGVPTTNITSTTFVTLEAYLTGAPNAADLTPDFERANWIVLAMQAIDPAIPSSTAARQLLAQRPELLTGKHVIGFLFGPPHNLTKNEMSHFTALYAVYGKTPPFVELAAHAMSGDAPTPGQSPINLSELDYDLTRQTEPDAAQVLSLFIGDEVVAGQPTPAPLKLRVGDSMKIRTGAIIDHNGHPVPDGTRVSFIFQYDDGSAATMQDAATQNGAAKTDYVLNKTGRLLVRARSEPALSSITLQITISEGGQFVVATLAPTPTPTITRSPTPTRTPSPTPTITSTPVPSFMQTWFIEKPKHAQWDELLLALIGVLLIGGGSFWRARNGRGDVSAALRTGLWAAIGGLIAYVLFDLGAPGSDWLRSLFGAGAALIVALIGGAISWLWLMRKQT